MHAGIFLTNLIIYVLNSFQDTITKSVMYLMMSCPEILRSFDCFDFHLLVDHLHSFPADFCLRPVDETQKPNDKIIKDWLGKLLGVASSPRLSA